MSRMVAQALAQAQRILIVSHEKPDGDALGSSIGLAHSLKARGKEPLVYSAGPIPEEYGFMPGINRVSDTLPAADELDLAVLLDCHQPERAGEKAGAFLKSLPRCLVVDHHQGEASFGETPWVDPAYSATAEMLTEMMLKADMPLNKEAACCLFVGITTDTGSFRYSNATARSFRLASELVDRGAPVWEISQQVYATRPKRIRLMADVLDSMRSLKGGRLAMAGVSLAKLESLGAGSQDLDMVVEVMRGIPGVEVAALIKEMPQGGVKASLRSKGKVDVAEIAISQGGGGHRNAAGFSSAEPLKDAQAKLADILSGRVDGIK